MQVLEDELSDAKLQCSKVNASSSAQKNNYEIAVSYSFLDYRIWLIIFFKDFTQNPTHILHIFTQIFHVCKVSSIEVDLLETGVKRCPDGLEIESITECKEACAYLKIPLSSNKFKEGKPCYKGGSHVCNQNGAFGRNAKLICKKPGNFKLTIV